MSVQKQSNPSLASATPSSSSGSKTMPADPSVSHDNLISLVKKKDKEVKTLEGKLSKIEDRYVKLVRFNKILHEDRASFLKFASVLVNDAETAFEEAAAQETPINFDLLARELDTVESKDREMNIYREFIRLAFPQDSLELLTDTQKAKQNLDLNLRQKWFELENKTNRSIQEANAVAEINMANQSDSIKQMDAEIQKLKNENTELDLQLQNLKVQQNVTKGQAQKLQNRILGNNSNESTVGSDGEDEQTQPSGSSSKNSKLEEQILMLQKENSVLEKKLAKMDASYRDELELSQKMLSSLKAQHSEEKKHILDQLSGKEKAYEKATLNIASMEDELDTSRMITKAAELQANRDLILKEQSEETNKLRFQVRDLDQKVRTAAITEKAMKIRIRELEVQTHANTDRTYMKDVIYKYIEYTQVHDMKARTLIPAICTMIGCTPKEKNALIQLTNSVPKSWQVLNQAVGTTWSAQNAEDTDKDNKPGTPGPMIVTQDQASPSLALSSGKKSGKKRVRHYDNSKSVQGSTKSTQLPQSHSPSNLDDLQLIQT